MFITTTTIQDNKELTNSKSILWERSINLENKTIICIKFSWHHLMANYRGHFRYNDKSNQREVRFQKSVEKKQQLPSSFFFHKS